MGEKEASERPLTDEEIAKRRDSVVKRMLKTPPKLHKESKGKRRQPAPDGKRRDS